MKWGEEGRLVSIKFSKYYSIGGGGGGGGGRGGGGRSGNTETSMDMLLIVV